MKAVILARVSTKEQEDGHSIEAQKARLLEYCRRKGLEVLRVFTVIESSTKGERKEFNAMLGFCKKQKETVAIVADAVDRIQRSFKESVLLDDLIRREKIELHFYRENMIIGKNASSVDIMRWDFSVMGAKSYVLQLSENVKRSLEYKRKNGERGGSAPVGYLNVKKDGKSWIEPDPARAVLVKRLFSEYAARNASVNTLAAKAKDWGLTTKHGGRISPSHVHNILRNPFYYGEMKIKDSMHPHKYAPIVSQELWEKCEAIRLGHGKKPVPYAGKEFLFRGLITCANSGKTVTTDCKKGRYNYLIYYDKDGVKHHMPEAEAVDQVETALEKIRVPEHILGLLKERLKPSAEAEKEYHLASLHNLSKEDAILAERQKKLLDLFLDGKVDEADYSTKSAEIKSRRSGITAALASHRKADDAFSATLGNLLSIAGNAADTWRKSSNIPLKREYIKTTIRTMKLNDGKLEVTMNYPFNLFNKSTPYPKWLGNLDSNQD